MSNKAFLAALHGELNSQMSAHHLTGRTDIAKVSLGTESDDNTVMTHGTFQGLLDDTITGILSNEDNSSLDIPAHIIQGAVDIAGYAMDPTESVAAMVSHESDASFDHSAPSMGIFDTATLSNEAFDSVSVGNALYFSVASVLITRQDELVEKFLPTIMLPFANGVAKVETTVSQFYENTLRDASGNVNTMKASKRSIIKSVRDGSLFGVDKNQLYPARTAANESNLDLSVVTQHPLDADGSTAPIKFGKTVDIIALGQTAAMMAKHTTDSHDQLHNFAQLENIYLTLDNTTDQDKFRIPTKVYNSSRFTYTPTDSSYDMQMSFESDEIVLNTSSSTKADGSASAVLADIGADHEITLRVLLNGQANTDRGSFAIYANAFELVSVKNSNGDALATDDAVYLAVKDVVEASTLDSYDVEIYVSDSVLRETGVLLTSETFSTTYQVPIRTGHSVVTPVGGNSTDSDKVAAQVEYTNLRMSRDGIDFILEQANTLDSLTGGNGVYVTNSMGVGTHHVNGYFDKHVFDVGSSVDSRDSRNRHQDIRAALIGRLKDMVLSAYYESNMSVAHEAMSGGKIDVVIGVNTRVGSLLTTEVDLGDKFNVEVVVTPDHKFGDTVIAIFGNLATNRNSEIKPTSFGNTFFRPTITTDVPRSVNGGTVRVVDNKPSYVHVMHTPIMVKIDVTNIDGGLGKIAAYSTAV